MAKINNTSSVSYKYTLPDQTEKTGSTDSNTSSTENMTTSFTKVKSADKEFGVLGDTLKLTLVLTNNSEYPITDINIKDTIDNKATFVAGSVEIDGTPQAEFNPVTSFNLPSELTANGGSSTITYSVTLNTEKPATDVYNFVSDITYSVNEISGLTEKSNVLTLELVNPTITITKSADKDTALQGDTIVYTNIIKNDGNVKHTLVNFTDQIPATVTLVSGSVKIDDTPYESYDPTKSFALGDLEIGGETKVEFSVTVN